MHLKTKVNKDFIVTSNKSNINMASSLLNDDEDNATRNTQQQQQQQNNNNCLNAQNNNNLNESSSNPTTNNNKMQDNEAKLKKQNLEQRKQELEKLLNEKSWLLQQLQKQETQILNGNFEYMNFNDFIQNLAVQYKQEQATANSNAGDSISTLSGGGSSNLTSGEEAILRRKPLTAKENHQNLNNNNVLHRRQSEISNRSSEYDNYPQHDSQSTHSEGGRGAIMHGAAQATQQYAAKAALKKRSATVAGTTAQSSTNLQMIRQQHLEQQQQQQLLYKQHQQQQQQQHHYHHPQQHLFKPHLEQHQVLMPHLQYATQKFYYTTLQPQTNANSQQQLQQQQLQAQQQQQQYGRYIQNKQIAQQQTLHHTQSPNQNLTQHQQQQLLLTPPSGSSITIDNISLYSLNSNNVATLHRPAQQQQPIIVQCDKYYLSPTTHHVSHNDGGGFIKSSQNIKEYVSPVNSPQHLRGDKRLQTSQSNLTQRGATPALDVISLAPSYVSMETIDYSTSPVASNMRWRSQSNLPPTTAHQFNELKSQSSDMLNNNQYYNTALNPPPPTNPTSSSLITQNHPSAMQPPPNVTQVKPFKPLDDISINSYTSSEAQKKQKPKQWLESSLDGPVIRQTPIHDEPSNSFTSNNNNNSQTRTKLSSQSLNTSSRHYSMSSAQTKSNLNQNPCSNNPHTKLSQSTSYLNQMDFINANSTSATPTPSISQAYNLELSPQNTAAYKYLSAQQQKPPARPPPSALYVNTSNTNLSHSATPTPPLAAALSPDIRIESPVNMTIVQPATFQPYKEVTKPFEMSDFYKYSTKFRQKENNNNNAEN